jgi:hypothetical protein
MKITLLMAMAILANTIFRKHFNTNLNLILWQEQERELVTLQG